PAGVQGPSGTSDENDVVTLEDPFDQSVSFDSLAHATGGESMHGLNDVDHLIGDAVENGETFYTLTYRPFSPTDADPTKFQTSRSLSMSRRSQREAGKATILARIRPLPRRSPMQREN